MHFTNSYISKNEYIPRVGTNFKQIFIDYVVWALFIKWNDVEKLQLPFSPVNKEHLLEISNTTTMPQH